MLRTIARWGGLGIVQTFYCFVLRKAPVDLPYRIIREELETGNGLVSLDWCETSEMGPSNPISLIIPGISGSSSNQYIRLYAKYCVEKGFRVAIMNWRGCGTAPLSTPVIPTFACTFDTRLVAEHVAQRYPQAPITATGFSLGGYTLLRYLGEVGEASPLAGGVVISQAFDSELARSHISERPLYDFLLAKKVTGAMKKHREMVSKDDRGEPLDMNLIMKAKTTTDLDEVYLKRILGPQGADLKSFYESRNPRLYLKDITVPVLCFNAFDDPLIPRVNLREFAAENPSMLIAATRTGGHLGWATSGGFLKPAEKSYMDLVAVDFLHAILKTSSN